MSGDAVADAEDGAAGEEPARPERQGEPGVIDVSVSAPKWTQMISDPEAFVARVIGAARSVLDVDPPFGDVSILLADDEELHRLNKTFRDRDKPTNVLAFPSGEMAGGEETFLGDIALAYETAAREARERGLAFDDHAAHLIAHGFLHLCGFDHIQPEDAQLMERVEVAALAVLGVSDPYIIPESDELA